MDLLVLPSYLVALILTANEREMHQYAYGGQHWNSNWSRMWAHCLFQMRFLTWTQRGVFAQFGQLELKISPDWQILACFYRQWKYPLTDVRLRLSVCCHQSGMSGWISKCVRKRAEVSHNWQMCWSRIAPWNPAVSTFNTPLSASPWQAREVKCLSCSIQKKASLSYVLFFHLK